jgi:hypothetical protein
MDLATLANLGEFIGMPPVGGGASDVAPPS